MFRLVNGFVCRTTDTLANCPFSIEKIFSTDKGRRNEVELYCGNWEVCGG